MTTLIAGFGNVLLGDDGFGVEVIKRLDKMALPDHVQTMDVGIGGLDLVLRLQNGFDEVIIVDAVRRGQAPGTLYQFTPSAAELDRENNEPLNPHVAEPLAAMRMAKTLGALPAVINVVGCEPQSCAPGIGLSAPVSAAIDPAVQAISQSVNRRCETETRTDLGTSK